MEKFIYEGIEINNIDEWWAKQDYYFSHSINEFRYFKCATHDYIWQFIRESANSETNFDFKFLNFMKELIRESEFVFDKVYKIQTDDYDIEEGWADQDYIYKDPDGDIFYALYVRNTRHELIFPDSIDFRKVIPVEETIVKYIDED